MVFLAGLTEERGFLVCMRGCGSICPAWLAGWLQVWDALLGNVKHAFLEVTSSDISAMCLDHRKRKIIVGDVQGAVQVDRQTDRRPSLPPSHSSLLLTGTTTTTARATTTGLLVKCCPIRVAKSVWTCC